VWVLLSSHALEGASLLPRDFSNEIGVFPIPAGDRAGTAVLERVRSARRPRYPAILSRCNRQVACRQSQHVDAGFKTTIWASSAELFRLDQAPHDEWPTTTFTTLLTASSALPASLVTPAVRCQHHRRYQHRKRDHDHHRRRGIHHRHVDGDRDAYPTSLWMRRHACRCGVERHSRDRRRRSWHRRSEPPCGFATDTQSASRRLCSSARR